MGTSERRFFDKVENRLYVTLILAVGFPIICSAFFPLFVFLIIPTTPLINSGAPWLYIYWISAAGNWLMLLAGVLPLMRKDVKNKVVLPEDPPKSDIGLRKLSSKGSSDSLDDKTKPQEEEIHKSGSSSPSSSTSLKSKKLESLEDSFGETKFTSANYEAAVHSSPKDKSSYQPLTKTASKPISGPEEGSHRHSTIEEEEEAVSLLEKSGEDRGYSLKSKVTETTYGHSESLVTTTEETYECSLPSPLPISGDRTSKNAVFLFVNNEDEPQKGSP